MKKVKNLNRYFIAIYTIIYTVVYLKLLYTYPYSSDDWMWGSKLGAELLHKGFSGYNGRYLGNLLVLVLTRNKMVKSLIMMAIFIIIIYLINKLINKTKDKFLFTTIAGLLLVFMPNQLLAQGVVWSAGFANYIPPMIFVLAYIVLCKRLIVEDNPSYTWLGFVGCTILGICASLFIEHVTMYNVVLAIAVIIFTLVKFKKVFKANIGYLIGAIIGTITMFSNASYWLISSGGDYDRKMGLNIVLKHLFGNIYRHLVEYNIALNLVLVILIILLYVKSVKTVGKNKIIGAFLVIYAVMYWCYSAYVYFTISLVKYDMYHFPTDARKLNLVGTILAVGFYITILLVIALYTSNIKNKILGILFILSVGTLTVPLFVVSPIGPRNFLPMYIFYVALVAVLIDEIDLNQKTLYVLAIIVCIITAVGAVRQYKIYQPMEKLYKERVQVQNYQIANGNVRIELPDTVKGNSENVWAWSPGSNWAEQYKCFFHIPVQDRLVYMKTKTWLEKYKDVINS